MNFIKNALREFKHVVWPTREETKKYFVVVMAVLCAFGLYLFIVWNIFSEILFWLKNFVNPNSWASAEIQLPEWLEGLELTPSDIPDVTGENSVDQWVTESESETIELTIPEATEEEKSTEVE